MGVKGLKKDLNYVGKTFPIHDAPQKVRGETVYVSDLKLPNMVYAKLLLSPIAHGFIKKLIPVRQKYFPESSRYLHI